MKKKITFRTFTKNCKHREENLLFACGLDERPFGIGQKKCNQKNCPIWKKLKTDTKSISIPVPRVNEYLVFIVQAGGKYGQFVCPTCQGLANWKFTAGYGECSECERVFQNSGRIAIKCDEREHCNVLKIVQSYP